MGVGVKGCGVEVELYAVELSQVVKGCHFRVSSCPRSGPGIASEKYISHRPDGRPI